MLFFFFVSIGSRVLETATSHGHELTAWRQKKTFSSNLLPACRIRNEQSSMRYQRAKKYWATPLDSVIGKSSCIKLSRYFLSYTHSKAKLHRGPTKCSEQLRVQCVGTLGIWRQNEMADTSRSCFFFLHWRAVEDRVLLAGRLSVLGLPPGSRFFVEGVFRSSEVFCLACVLAKGKEGRARWRSLSSILFL